MARRSLRFVPVALSRAFALVAFAGTAPLAAQRAAVQISLAPHHPYYVNTALGASILSFSTPAYVSRDVPRGITLVYNSGQEQGVGFVQVNVTETSTDLPVKYGIKVYRNGTLLANELFYQAAAGTSRLAAKFASPTSASNYDVVVRSYWADGSALQAQVSTKILVINEQQSVFGGGWTMPGLQRVLWTDDGAMVLNGDGTAVFFTRACNGCAYAAPDGEFSRLSQNTDGTWVRAYPDSSRARFTGTGLITGYEDRAGRTQQTFRWSSTSDGRPIPTAVVDPAGARDTLAYYASGYLYTITDPGGRVSRFNYYQGTVSQIWSADGRTALLANYDAVNKLTSYTDAAGGQWDVTYDAPGGLASITAPSIGTSDAGTTRPVSQTRSPWAAVLPAAGFGTSAAPAARVDTASVRVSTTDARGNVVRATLDRFGAPIRIDAPYGQWSTIERNQHGQATRTISFLGDTMLATWNGVELTRVVDVLRKDTVWTDYESTWHQPVYIRHGLQRDSIYYDANGAVQRMVSLGGGTRQEQVYSWQPDGRLYSVTDPAGHGAFYSYEGTSSGKLDNTWIVETGVSGYSTNRRTTYTRDAFGRDTMVISPNSDTTRTGYDVLNRVTRQRDARGNTTAFVFDSLGLARVTDAKNQVYGFTRNALGWVTGETDPRSSSIGYQYDRAGNVTSTTNRRTQTVTLAYDSLNRVVSRNAAGAVTTWSYGMNGLWAAVSNAESTDTVKLDAAGRVLSTVVVRGSNKYTLQNTNDAQGRRTQLSITGPWTGAYTTGYRYNDRSQVDSIIDFAGTRTAMMYDTEGMWTGPSLPMNLNSFGITRSYMSTHVPSEIGYPPSVADVLNTGYNLNANGLVGGRTQRFTDPYGALGTEVRRYTYDRAGQITASSITNYLDADGVITCSNNNDPNLGKCLPTPAGGSLVESYSYNWDAVGNPVGSSYTVENGNRLTHSTPYTLEYDADGNLTRKYRTDATPFDQRLYWNALGQLDSAKTNGTTVRYGYNGLGQRVRAGTRQFIYDGDDLLMELNASGTPDRMFTYYPGVDNPHSLRTANGATYYYATDYPGNVVALINKNRKIVAQYGYSDFGQSYALIDSIGGQPLQFAGRELDSATGLYYNRARWYDPSIGRFVSEDPIRLAGGPNLYTYVSNSPLNNTDPSGLCELWATIRTWYSGRTVTRVDVLKYYWVGDDCGQPRNGSAGGGSRRRDNRPTDCAMLAGVADLIGRRVRQPEAFIHQFADAVAGVHSFGGLDNSQNRLPYGARGGFLPQYGGDAPGQARHFAGALYGALRIPSPWFDLVSLAREARDPGGEEDDALSIRASQLEKALAIPFVGRDLSTDRAGAWIRWNVCELPSK